MIVASAIQTIQDAAIAAATPHRLDVQDARQAHFRHPDPTAAPTFSIPTPPEPREYSVLGLPSLIALAVEATTEAPDIWIAADAIRLVFDRKDRRDTATHIMPYSHQWAILRTLQDKREAMTQDCLVRLLRLDLAAPPDVILPLRNLRWSRDNSAASKLDVGNESLGQAVEARVAGADNLPETVTIAAPIYETADEHKPVTVACLLDYDLEAQRIRMVPAPQAIADAERDTAVVFEQAIRTAIADCSHVHVYRGKP